MKARDLMKENVVVCHPEDALNRAAQLMWDNDCGCVPVVDGSGRIAGMVTDRDICMAAYTRGLPIDAISVECTMNRDVKTCQADDPIDKIEAIMQGSRIRRVPVVDSECRVVGIVSLNDLAIKAQTEHAFAGKKAADKLHVAETLAAVCSHRECAVA